MPTTGWLYYVQLGLLAFFLIPLVEAIIGLVGTAHAHEHYKTAPWKFTKAIIQITTTGREEDLVRQTIRTVRAYNLSFPYEIWVVSEPGHTNHYPEANRTIVVPEDFECKPVQKARALEFSRRERVKLGLNTADIKIILMDDDSIPSKAYFIKAYGGDYDLCQGATVTNRYFGQVNWKHFFLSHLDNIRVRNCVIYCSLTQGITGKPLFVHGEGLTMTGMVEDKITWDHPIIASDDLVFGTRAAAMGFTWGYFNEAIQIISPWTFKEAWKQRKRWTWGNITAIFSREILPLSVAIPKGLKYLLGCVSIVASTTGAVLLATGHVRVPPQMHAIYLVSLVCWFGSYGVAAWINSGGQPNRDRYFPAQTTPQPQGTYISIGRRRYDRRVLIKAGTRYYTWRALQAIAGTIMTPVTSMLPVFIIIASLVSGRPKSFVVIDKTIPGLIDKEQVTVS